MAVSVYPWSPWPAGSGMHTCPLSTAHVQIFSKRGNKFLYKLLPRVKVIINFSINLISFKPFNICYIVKLFSINPRLFCCFNSESDERGKDMEHQAAPQWHDHGSSSANPT